MHRQTVPTYWVALTCKKPPSSGNDRVPESTKRCSTGVKIHREIISPDLLCTYRYAPSLAAWPSYQRESTSTPPTHAPSVICACAIQSSVPVVQSSIPVVQSRGHSSLHCSPWSSYSRDSRWCGGPSLRVP